MPPMPGNAVAADTHRMTTFVDLLGLAAFFGAPALFLGIGAGRRLARFGAPSALALVAGGAIGMACGAVLAVMMILDVQSSTDANAALALILLPIPFVTNVLMGTLAAFVAFEWSIRC
jgi:hypothetical protein